MATLLDGLFSGGAIPSMERALRFASTRHRVLLENIANADTPGYRRKDLETSTFRETLRVVEAEGPQGVLRHDGNNVDLEMELAHLGKNGVFHNQMAALLRKTFEQIRMAAAERTSAS